MWANKLITWSSLWLVTLALAGVILYGWHLAIHPEPQLSEPEAGPVPRRVEGMAAMVAVANRHDDDTALRFSASVHGRDRRNFRRHLSNIATLNGWYPHDRGRCQALVVPEADLPMLLEMEADPVGWVQRQSPEATSTRTFQEAELLNASVCVRGNLRSGALRVLAIFLWVVAIFPALGVLVNLVPDPPSDGSPSETG